MVMRRRRLEWFGHVKSRVKLRTKELKWRWRGSALEEDQSWGGKILSGGTWKPHTSGRNGSLTDRDRWKGLCKTRYASRTGRGRQKVIKLRKVASRGGQLYRYGPSSGSLFYRKEATDWFCAPSQCSKHTTLLLWFQGTRITDRRSSAKHTLRRFPSQLRSVFSMIFAVNLT